MNLWFLTLQEFNSLTLVNNSLILTWTKIICLSLSFRTLPLRSVSLTFTLCFHTNPPTAPPLPSPSALSFLYVSSSLSSSPVLWPFMSLLLHLSSSLILLSILSYFPQNLNIHPSIQPDSIYDDPSFLWQQKTSRGRGNLIQTWHIPNADICTDCRISTRHTVWTTCWHRATETRTRRESQWITTWQPLWHMSVSTEQDSPHTDSPALSVHTSLTSADPDPHSEPSGLLNRGGTSLTNTAGPETSSVSMWLWRLLLQSEQVHMLRFKHFTRDEEMTQLIWTICEWPADITVSFWIHSPMASCPRASISTTQHCVAHTQTHRSEHEPIAALYLSVMSERTNV